VAAYGLRRHRLDAGHTVSDFARALRVRRETLCRLESGARTPSLRLAARIERATDGAVPAVSWAEEDRDDESI
jgi:DNA-binding XRE family transcriptional regulator